MKEISAYNVKTCQKTTMKNTQLITMKNSKHALKNIAADDNQTTLFRIISAAEAQKIKADK
jgi:hypothetical protein